MWPAIACVYILIGGIASLGLVRTRAASTLSAPLDLAVGFALICGCIALWPVLLALAIDSSSGGSRRKR